MSCVRFLEIVVVNNLRSFFSSPRSSNTFNVNVCKRIIPILWNVDVMISHQCNDSLLSDIKLKWKRTKIFKVRKILIKSYVNLNRVKYVPIIHLPKAGLTIKSKLLMNLNLRNSDFLCKTRKSEIKCQSLLWLWWQCNARNHHCTWSCSLSCPGKAWNSNYNLILKHVFLLGKHDMSKLQFRASS